MREHQFDTEGGPWRIGCAACPRRAECASPCAGAESYASQDDPPSAWRETPLSDLGEGEGGAALAVDAALGRELWEAGEAAGMIAGVAVDAARARDAVASLTALQLRRARLYWLEGLSVREIAERERTAVGAVSESLARALERIAGALLAAASEARRFEQNIFHALQAHVSTRESDAEPATRGE